MNSLPKILPVGREIVLRTRGRRHGPIIRLVSPGDVGELIKPFVFLDLFDLAEAGGPVFGWHPHSGIATVTVLQSGSLGYEETTGAKGILSKDGVEWMRAGRGVWHTGNPCGRERTRGFQLWLALPEDLETAANHSRYLSAAEVPSAGPARVILGAVDGVRSPVPAPMGINYLDVRLSAGQAWTYQPPPDHEVLWLALSEGAVRGSAMVEPGELVVFEESNEALVIEAATASRFVLGSARKHPHELVLGNYSVHTSSAALAAGEAEIQRIGRQLLAAGILK
jgi:redox-sensitive bicupin YhaK (pirin superfamily)